MAYAMSKTPYAARLGASFAFSLKLREFWHMRDDSPPSSKHHVEENVKK
jgi:hypothetical protein